MQQNKDRFFIPKKIHVGYVNRESTYTGKLAYVIYTDHTNKLRKEKSWNSWRDKNINPDDFDNVPTEGFVLNKHVGGYKSWWNYRQSYCRIYDPRGFEIEITINNLLWILEWEDCIKGKGLSGKYVYGWVYDDLYLIPCSTDDYIESQKISDAMYKINNSSKNDLVPGALYKIKQGYYGYNCDELVFVGNLKTQNRIGKRYKSELFFYDIKNPNQLIRVDKKNIKAKLADDTLSKEEIDELIIRFNRSAYSYEFWNTTNIIKEFTDKKLVDSLKTDYNSSENHIKNYAKIVDSQHVILFKQYLYLTKREHSYYSRWYGGSYYTRNYKSYKFMTLDSNMNKEILCDFGPYNNDSSYYSDGNENSKFPEDIYYEYAPEELFAKATFEDAESCVYYITNDGYFSDTLNSVLIKQALSELHDISSSKFSIINLPVKL